MKVFILADLEGIIGVKDLNDMAQCRALMLKEIGTVLTTLKKLCSCVIWVCNIHGEGDLLTEDDARELGANLVNGVKLMTQQLEWDFDFAIMVGFHGKKDSGGVFDHTFRNDILRVEYKGNEVGEVAAFKSYIEHKGVPVIFVSGEGNLKQELLGSDCAIHYAESGNGSSVDLEEFYLKLSVDIQRIYERFMCDIQSWITEHTEGQVRVFIDNPDKYEILHDRYELDTTADTCFLFQTMDDFLLHLYDFCHDLSSASLDIYRENVQFVQKMRLCINRNIEPSFEIKELLKQTLFSLSRCDRLRIAEQFDMAGN